MDPSLFCLIDRLWGKLLGIFRIYLIAGPIDACYNEKD